MQGEWHRRFRTERRAFKDDRHMHNLAQRVYMPFIEQDLENRSLLNQSESRVWLFDLWIEWLQGLREHLSFKYLPDTLIDYQRDDLIQWVEQSHIRIAHAEDVIRCLENLLYDVRNGSRSVYTENFFIKKQGRPSDPREIRELKHSLGILYRIYRDVYFLTKQQSLSRVNRILTRMGWQFHNVDDLSHWGRFDSDETNEIVRMVILSEMEAHCNYFAEHITHPELVSLKDQVRHLPINEARLLWERVVKRAARLIDGLPAEAKAAVKRRWLERLSRSHVMLLNEFRMQLDLKRFLDADPRFRG